MLVYTDRTWHVPFAMSDSCLELAPEEAFDMASGAYSSSPDLEGQRCGGLRWDGWRREDAGCLIVIKHTP
jgi:hypothetical protein